jgi:hypothetical protein
MMRRTFLLPFVAGIAVMALMVGGVALVRSGGAGGIDPSTSEAMALSSHIDGSSRHQTSGWWTRTAA